MSPVLRFVTKPRTLATGIALGRVVLGAAAVARPELPAKGWVGAGPATTPAVQVLGRALGGRDIALGALALAGGSKSRRLAVGLGAAADVVDMSATLLHWKDLPPRDRWGILALTGAAAGLGAWAALG